jgi:hypothetical protein
MTATYEPYTLETLEFASRNVMNAEVNILITVDAETLLKDFNWNGKDPIGSASEPQQLNNNPGKYLRLQVRNGNRGTENPSDPSDLEVYAARRQNVCWREATMSLNSVYYAMLYDYEHSSGEYIFGKNGNKPKVTANVATNVLVPLPDAENPTKPRTQKIQDYFWMGTVVTEPGTWEKYLFSFMVLKANDDETALVTCGYFKWDPKITVKKPS